MDQSRRQILKLIASAPLVLSFGFAGEALMRFVKPTMSPFGLFDPADAPASALREFFTTADLPETWNCIPFMYSMRFAELNPEKQVVRAMPAFVIRLPGDQFVAFSRVCPRGCICLNYVMEPREINCGCAPPRERCCCAVDIDNPVLICPCDGSVFDPADGGRVIRGTASRPPRKISLKREGDTLVVVGMRYDCIQ